MDTSQLPVRPIYNPLNAEHEAALRNVVERLKIRRDLIDRAKAVGLDMTQHDDRHAIHHQAATQLLQQFFPQTMTVPDESSDATE